MELLFYLYMQNPTLSVIDASESLSVHPFYKNITTLIAK